MDIDNIPFGTDFRHHLQETLDRCDILLVVVGPRWFGRNQDGQHRLFEEADWVRLEVATALAKKIPVIPLLVEGARMPKPSELPSDSENFAYRQAAVLDMGVDFRVHMERLTKSMDRILAHGKSPEPQPVSETLFLLPQTRPRYTRSRLNRNRRKTLFRVKLILDPTNRISQVSPNVRWLGSFRKACRRNSIRPRTG
jgi:hypothetical protein